MTTQISFVKRMSSFPFICYNAFFVYYSSCLAVFFLLFGYIGNRSKKPLRTLISLFTPLANPNVFYLCFITLVVFHFNSQRFAPLSVKIFSPSLSFSEGLGLSPNIYLDEKYVTLPMGLTTRLRVRESLFIRGVVLGDSSSSDQVYFSPCCKDFNQNTIDPNNHLK